MLKCNLYNDVGSPEIPLDNETSVGRLIQYKAKQAVVVVELAFLRFSTFSMLLKYTRFPWNVGWASERCVRRMEVDTERERWREAKKEGGEWKYLLQWLERFGHNKLRRE